jgi:hypothetical protein
VCGCGRNYCPPFFWRTTPPRHLLLSFRENEAGGIDAHNLITCRLRRSPNAAPSLQANFFYRRQEGTMSDVDEKLIVKLGQQIKCGLLGYVAFDR